MGTMTIAPDPAAWIKWPAVKANFQHLNKRDLNAWVASGAVRSIKHGKAQQCSRVYSLADLSRACDKQAAGRKVSRNPSKRQTS